MSAPHADYFAQLAREAIAEAKAKWLAEHPPKPPSLPETTDTTSDEDTRHAQAARAALRGTTEGDVDE